MQLRSSIPKKFQTVTTKYIAKKKKKKEIRIRNLSSTLFGLQQNDTTLEIAKMLLTVAYWLLAVPLFAHENMVGYLI